MNKIRKIIADKIANLKDKRVNDYADGFNDGLIETFKIFLEETDELVNKETPMLVTDIHVDEFYCPKCHAEITHDISNYGARPKYCEECGQRLYWGEYE